jgi:hypothetical protein
MLINRSNVTITGDGPNQTILRSNLVATTGISFPASIIRTYPTLITQTTLTQDAAEGTKSITVASSTGFSPGDRIKFSMVGTQHLSELNRVLTVPDSTHITLEYPVVANYDKDTNTTYIEEIAFVENLIVERLGFHGNAGLDDRATHIKEAINATIQDCYAQDFGTGAFGFDNGVEGGLIYHNTVKNTVPLGGATKFGALIAEADRGVSIRDNYVTMSGTGASCIYVTTVSETLIEGNRCINASSSSDGMAVKIVGGSRDIRIANNYFYGFARGMSFRDECHDAGTCNLSTRAPNPSGRIQIVNNTFDSIGNSTGAGGVVGFTFGEATTFESKITDIDIIGNTFMNMKFDNVFYFAYGSDRIRFLNNNLIENDNSSAGSQFMYFDGKNGGHSDVTIDGNYFKHTTNAFGSGSSNGMTAIFLAQATGNTACTGSGAPYACCTGVGTGTCTTKYERWRVSNNKFEMTLGTNDPLTVSGTNTDAYGLGNELYGNTVIGPAEWELQPIRNVGTDQAQWNGMFVQGQRVKVGTELMGLNSSNEDNPGYCIENYLTDACILFDNNRDNDASYGETGTANDLAWVYDKDIKTTQVIETNCGSIASAATITADNCTMLTLTGNTQIDTIQTCASHLATRELTVICGSSTAAFGDLTGNINTAGDKTCAANRIFTFVCDGSTWQQTSVTWPSGLAWSSAPSSTSIHSASDVTIATKTITGMVAGEQYIAKAVFTIVNDTNGTRSYTFTMDWDSLFDIELTSLAMTNSATLNHTFTMESVLSINTTSLAYETSHLMHSATGGQADGTNVTATTGGNGIANAWGTTTSNATGSTDFAFKARSSSATGTAQTLRLHSLTITKVTP